MKGFLKCFYGYKNLGDEILFWGVLDYIDKNYPKVDSLWVQVQDRHRMSTRFSNGRQDLQENNSTLGGGFVNLSKKVVFVENNYNFSDNFDYDMYFFGGGEVFSESRGFHGGRNYLLRYFFAIHSKPFVLLGGLETDRSLFQRILYAYVLPKAKSIVCRDKKSYKTARKYSRYAIQWNDFALDLKDHLPLDDNKKPSKPYILINMIEHMAKPEYMKKIEIFLTKYPDHDVFYVPCTLQDAEYATWIQAIAPHAEVFDRTRHSIVEILELFAYAKAGIGCRLHFLLLLQMFDTDRLAIPYAEKVKKIITSTVSL